MERYGLGEPVTIAGYTLLPIERQNMEAAEGTAGLWLHVEKEPLAILVCHQDSCYGLDMNGARFAVGHLAGYTEGMHQ